MLKLAHIGLRVRDMDKSRTFYEKAMGFNQVRTTEMEETRLSFLELGGTTLELVEKKSKPYPEGNAAIHLAFEVVDIRSEIRRLQDLGIPLEASDPVAFQDGFLFFFKGPDGEVLELCQN